MATKLAGGTIIYKEIDENTSDYLYIKSDGKYMKYIAAIEE